MTFQISTFIFIGVSLVLFYISAPKYKKTVLSAASLFFCFRLEPYALAVLMGMMITAYAAGLLLGRIREKNNLIRRTVYWSFVLTCVILMIGWKYLYGTDDTSFIRLAVPVGLSFYTFQAISYICDIYQNKIPCEKNLIKFILYMSWFPKLVSGPIERAGDFMSQIDRLDRVKLFDGERIIRAFSYILCGLFLKFMIADRAGIIVDSVFERTDEFGSLMLVSASILYTIQIYCDFAGYTDMAIGVSCLFGIELSQNFKTPYYSENISEFWRSWHITLSSFLRDYVYIPLGGNRKGGIRKAVNTLIVFIACGIWHGTGLGFIVWGLLHGSYIIAADLLKKTRFSFLTKKYIGTVLTFCSVSFAWIFFRAGSLSLAIRYINSVFSAEIVNGSIAEELINAGSGVSEAVILGMAALLFAVCEYVAFRGRTVIPDILIKMGEVSRDIAFLVCSIIILIFGLYGNLEVKDFIYMNF